MVAVAEAFKLLAGFAGQQLEAALIEFDGYASRLARVRAAAAHAAALKRAAPARRRHERRIAARLR